MTKEQWVLHPKQFEANEAWIAFRLNSKPIRTELDGDFNCIALMDAASCFILGSELVPAIATESASTRVQFRRLLKNAQRHKDRLPKTLIVPRGDVADLLTREVARQSIEVVQVAETALLIYIGEARQEFAARFEEDRGDA